MYEPESPIIDFYPPDFEIDMNGKKMQWQGVALLPFIDPVRLLEAMGPRYPALSEDDVKRNAPGRDVLFVADKHALYDAFCRLYSKKQKEGAVRRSVLLYRPALNASADSLHSPSLCCPSLCLPLMPGRRRPLIQRSPRASAGMLTRTPTAYLVRPFTRRCRRPRSATSPTTTRSRSTIASRLRTSRTGRCFSRAWSRRGRF